MVKFCFHNFLYSNETVIIIFLNFVCWLIVPPAVLCTFHESLIYAYFCHNFIIFLYVSLYKYYAQLDLINPKILVDTNFMFKIFYRFTHALSHSVFLKKFWKKVLQTHNSFLLFFVRICKNPMIFISLFFIKTKFWKNLAEKCSWHFLTDLKTSKNLLIWVFYQKIIKLMYFFNRHERDLIIKYYKRSYIDFEIFLPENLKNKNFQNFFAIKKYYNRCYENI